MALLNYTSPFLATANAPASTFYHSGVPQFHPQTPPPPPPPGPYSYPTPRKPFLDEDYGAQRSPLGGSFNHQHHHHQQQQQQPQNHHSHHHQQQQQQQPPLPSTPNQLHQQHQFQSQSPLQPTFTKVTDDGTKTKVHAVIDYDDYEDDDVVVPPPVTPIQGPIFLKNGSVPVVPLYSHPVLNNGTFVQIPILWTALSVALGLELRGEYIRGVPCIKRHQQLFCPTAGNSYPLDRIELFIDENKALMKRMYGEFDMSPDFGGGGGVASGKKKRKRSVNKPGVPDLHFDPGPNPSPINSPPSMQQQRSNAADSLFGQIRNARQNFRANQSSESGRIDACESKVEIVTPYWASNSAGKIRAIVNTQHFEQAIHQEVCAKVRTSRCSGDCGCEQKYKWHRLLAYDPDNDCKGIFMDWFLFPSCCVCRCNPT